MLYPKENHAQKKLILYCRNCHHEEEAKHTCVYVGDLQGAGRFRLIHVRFDCANQWPLFIFYSNEHKGKLVHRDIALDPTLPRAKDVDCAKCHGNEAIFFNPSKESMDLLFVCVNSDCNHHWDEKKASEGAKKDESGNDS